MRKRPWIRATCPDGKFRDGRRAVEEATIACELSAWKDIGCLRSLGVARAEAGDFDAAIQWETKVLEMVTDEEDRASSRELIEQFGRKQPYRDVRPADGSRRAGLPVPGIPLTTR